MLSTFCTPRADRHRVYLPLTKISLLLMILKFYVKLFLLLAVIWIFSSRLFDQPNRDANRKRIFIM